MSNNGNNSKPPSNFLSGKVIVAKESILYSIIVSPKSKEVGPCSLNMCAPVNNNCSSCLKYGCGTAENRKEVQEKTVMESRSSIDDSDEEFVDAYEYEDNSDYLGMKWTSACPQPTITRQNSNNMKSTTNNIYIALRREVELLE